MTTIVLDAEANGFLPIVDKIWVVCAKVLGEDEVFSFRDPESLLKWAHDLCPERIVGHNYLGYDAIVLKKVWGIDYTVGRSSTFAYHNVQYIDTMVLSQRLNPDREGGHSLANFGKILGDFKIEHEDFSQWSQEMNDYCVQDVKVTERVYNLLLKEIERQ